VLLKVVRKLLSAFDNDLFNMGSLARTLPLGDCESFPKLIFGDPSLRAIRLGFFLTISIG
jgi:hypothetical protein